MAAPNKQPKIMSSRLAGMAFMKRATAASPSTPSTPAEPPSKKQRLSNGSSIRSPATPTDSADVAKQESAGKGETKWYLSFKEPQVQKTDSPLRIIWAGYSALDAAGRDDEPAAADDEEQMARPQVNGRKSFGNFGKAEKKKQGEESSEDEEGSEDEGDISDDPTGVKALLAQGQKEAADRARAERKAKKAADVAESQRLAEQRRKKEVNLNRVTSISSGGASGNGGRLSGGGRKKDTSYFENMECHRCGAKGHMKKNCPQGGGARR